MQGSTSFLKEFAELMIEFLFMGAELLECLIFGRNIMDPVGHFF